MAEYDAHVGVQIKAIADAQIQSLKTLKRNLQEVIKELEKMQKVIDSINGKKLKIVVDVDSNKITNAIKEIQDANKELDKMKEETSKPPKQNGIKQIFGSFVGDIKKTIKWSKEVFTQIDKYSGYIIRAFKDVGNALNFILSKVNSLYLSLNKLVGTKISSFIKQFVGISSLVTVLNKSVNSASDLTENYNMFATAFNENIKGALENVKKINSQLALSINSVIKMQAQFKNSLSTIASNISESEKAQLANTLSRMAIDYASLYNLEIEDATSKFKSALSNQVRPIRDTSGYDVVIGYRADDSYFQYAESFVSNSLSLRSLLTIYAITQQMKNTKAFEDFAKTIETPANQMKVLKEQLQDFIAKCAEKNIDVVADALTDNKNVSKRFGGNYSGDAAFYAGSNVLGGKQINFNAGENVNIHSSEIAGMGSNADVNIVANKDTNIIADENIAKLMAKIGKINERQRKNVKKNIAFAKQYRHLEHDDFLSKIEMIDYAQDNHKQLQFVYNDINENDYINCGMAERCPDAKPVFVADGQEVDLGNRILELIHIPGHTKGSVAIYDKKSKALFAGDTVQDGFVYMFGGHRDTDAYGKSLEKLIARKNDINVYYACHGTLELPNDYPEKMLVDWEKTLAGECPYEEMNLHGQDVKAYKGSCCGFFLQ